MMSRAIVQYVHATRDVRIERRIPRRVIWVSVLQRDSRGIFLSRAL